jgi:hypothetical protein
MVISRFARFQYSSQYLGTILIFQFIIWIFGDLELWRFGDLEIWRFGFKNVFRTIIS